MQELVGHVLPPPARGSAVQIPGRLTKGKEHQAGEGLALHLCQQEVGRTLLQKSAPHIQVIGRRADEEPIAARGLQIEAIEGMQRPVDLGRGVGSADAADDHPAPRRQPDVVAGFLLHRRQQFLLGGPEVEEDRVPKLNLLRRKAPAPFF